MSIDYEALFGGTDYDPCAALGALRPAYMRMLAGEQEVEIRFRDRTVRFADTNPAEMSALISRLEGECAAKTGQRRRFAITAMAR